MHAEVEVPAPLHLGETLWQARFGPLDPCLRVVDGSIWRATRTPHGPATERLRVRGPGGPSATLVVDAWGPGAAWLVERAPALCGARDRPEQFRDEVAPTHPVLHNLARRHPGLRIGSTHAVFEAAMGNTLEQRVATTDAWRSWRAMVRALGEPAPGPLGPGLWVPPAPERVARTPYDVFHRFGIERRRGDVLRRLAIVARRLEEAVDLSHAQAYARLQAIPGIGPWTAAQVGLMAFGDADAVAVGDLHLPHLVSWSLAGERRGTDQRMLELLEPFRGHRGRVIRLLMAGALGPMRSLAV